MAKITVAKSRDKRQVTEKHNHFMVEEPISLINKMFLQNNKKTIKIFMKQFAEQETQKTLKATQPYS